MSSETVTTSVPLTLGSSRREAELPLLVLEPTSGWRSLNLLEIWKSRELLFFLTWRDVKIRYKQTVLGAAWAVLQPLLNMIVFTVLFGRLAGMQDRTAGMPYPLFVFAGLLPWTFFANGITTAGTSLVSSQNLITKVYFPRLIVPFASLAAGLVDLGISFVVLVAMMLCYQVYPGVTILLLPVVLIFNLLATAGIGCLVAGLTVAYRDFRYIVPFLMQLWLFVTPVMYPSSIVPEKWHWLFALNPMFGLVEGFRGCLLNRPEQSPAGALLYAFAGAAVLFCLGLLCFRRIERRLADIV
jgi:lipopolysaccharide transport system permease protein